VTNDVAPCLGGMQGRSGAFERMAEMGEYVLGPIFDEAGNDHATMFYLHSGGSVVTIIHSVYYDYAVDIVTKLNALEDINPESVPDMVEALKSAQMCVDDCWRALQETELKGGVLSASLHVVLTILDSALSKAGVR